MRLAGSWLDYQVAVGTVPDDEIVLVADGNACFVAVTANVERYLGIDRQALLGMSIADITPPAERPRVAEAWAAFVKIGAAHGPYQLWRRDGEEVPASFQAKANLPARGLHTSRLTVMVTSEIEPDPATASAAAVARTKGRISETRELLQDLRGPRPATLIRPIAAEPAATTIIGRRLEEAV